MQLEEVSDRLEFLESLCDHGPWKTSWHLLVPRCVNCGAPADHQLEPEDYVK